MLTPNKLGRLRDWMRSTVAVIVPPAPITLLAPAYADDMSASGAVQGRTNWTMIDNPNNMAVDSGAAHNTAQYGPQTSASFGAAQSDTFFARFGYDRRVSANGDPYDEQRVTYRFWDDGAGNYMRVKLNASSGRMSVTPVVNGNAGGDKFFNGISFKDHGEIALMMRAGKLTAMVDGRWAPIVDGIYSYPFDVMDLTGIASRSGKVGLAVNTFRNPVLDYISVTSVGFAVDSIDEFTGLDGTLASGATTGKALMAGTMQAGASPSRWIYRLFNKGDLKTVVQDWRDMTSVAVTGSTMTGFVSRPVGGPYIVQGGYVDSSDGKARVAFSKETTCGIRGEGWGQSNELNRRGAGDANSQAKVDGAATSVANDATPAGTWATSSNALGTNTMNTAAKIIAAALGMPVGIGVQGVPSTGLADLLPGTPNWNNVLLPALQAHRGTIEFWQVDQGENDADADSPPTGWSSKFLNQLLPGLRNVSGNPNALVFISPVGRFAATSAPRGDAATNDAFREVLRQQQLACVAADSRVLFSDSKLGALHSDAYHYDNGSQGYSEMARRYGYSVAKSLGANIADGRGALPTTATRSGSTIDIAVDLNGGTALSGPTNTSTGGAVPTPTLQGRLGFQVSADNFATTLAHSADPAIVGGKIRLTLAADPGGPVKVRSHYGWSYDDTVLFYTTGYADGRAGIPLFPIMTPIAAA